MRRGATCAGIVLALIGGEASGQGELDSYSSGVADDQFGAAVAGAGDVDGDGVPDVVVGAPEAFLFGASGPGRATVHSGADGSVLHTFTGEATGDSFGIAVAGVGDLDGDGRADVAVGATPPLALFGPSGTVDVRSGLDGSVLHRFVGVAAGDGFGRAVAGAGDVNLDGVPDVVVGAPYAAQGLSASVGLVRVHSGLDGAVLLSEYGEAAPSFLELGDQLGISVDGAGDVDGDGRADVLAGTSNAFIFTQGEGNLFHVLSGANGAKLATFHGDDPFDALGRSVSGAGDLDNDGTPDFVAGAPTDSNLGFALGSARACSGADGSILRFLPGPAGGSHFGSSVRGLGDVDADGHDDFAVSGLAPFDGSGTVAATVFSGADGLPLAGYLRDTPKDAFGGSLALGAPGDVDGDGHADLLLGLNLPQGVGEVDLLAPHLLDGAPIPSSSFTPGDTLTGTITKKKERDEGRLLAAPSTKLVLTVEVTDGNLKPIVAIHSVKNGKVGKKIAQWKGGKKPLKKKLKKAGEYAVRVSGKGKSAGAWRITTTADLPDEALPRQTVEPTKKTKVDGASLLAAEADVAGFSGGRLDVTVTPLSSFTPAISVIAPSGSEVPAAHYAVSADGDQRTLQQVPLLETGVYRIRVVGGAAGDDVAFDLAPALPPSGLLLELD